MWGFEETSLDALSGPELFDELDSGSGGDYGGSPQEDVGTARSERSDAELARFVTSREDWKRHAVSTSCSSAFG